MSEISVAKAGIEEVPVAKPYSLRHDSHDLGVSGEIHKRMSEFAQVRRQDLVGTPHYADLGRPRSVPGKVATLLRLPHSMSQTVSTVEARTRMSELALGARL